jgi:hypothetical protein
MLPTDTATQPLHRAAAAAAAATRAMAAEGWVPGAFARESL